MKQSFALVGIIMTSLACSDGDDDGINPAVSAAAQSSTDGTKVQIASIDAAEAGFIAIYGDLGDAPVGLLGHRAVPRGRSTNLDITLTSTIQENRSLWAVLHRDTGQLGTFENPTNAALDPPAKNGAGQDVRARFDVALEVAANLVETEDPSIEDASILEIDRIDITKNGFVRIVQEVAGAPSFPAIGVASIAKGRHLELPISLERNAVDDEKLVIFLHEDSNANGALDWTGSSTSEDPPLRDSQDQIISISVTVTSTLPPTEEILARDQVLTSSVANVQLISVVSSEDGFVALYLLEQDGDLILPPLAHAPVTMGLSPLVDLQDVIVPLGASEVEAVLHRDSDDDGIFEYDGGALDPPAERDGDRIGAAFEVTRSPE
ncbi:MAG: hypothetical protein HC923_08145 [Myxococcales bacterium]|nr:hypothetical protein [Myxococcales bacterium]